MEAFSRFMIGFFAGEETSYQVVHANFFMSGLVGLHIKAAFGTPLVTTFHALGRVRRIHQGADDGFPDARFDIEDRLVAQSDSVIAECPQDEADLLSLYHADAARIDLVPCGFDSAEFQPADKARAREKLGWPRDRFIALQLGRMVPRKGIDNVVRAIGICNRQLDEATELYVVGGNSDHANEVATPEIGRLRAIAQDCGASNHVSFLGRHGRARLSTFYNAADVFVTTPWYEPFGITPLEAMACAKPVIGADVGGIRYSVMHGETGLLVPPNNAMALAAALVKLKHDPVAAQRMGAAGLARAKAMFTWTDVAQSLTRIYARVAGIELPAQAQSAQVLMPAEADSFALGGTSI
jgi:glycosyltransferase involved in cell wall biosynthesis